MTAPAVVELDTLQSGLRAWLEGLLTSGSVLLRRDGNTIGTLTYSPAVLEGTIVPASATDHATKRSDLREGTKVLATTMRLSSPARDLLRQSLARTGSSSTSTTHRTPPMSSHLCAQPAS